eukprot:5149500-Amphidinium_carterae.1
MELELGRQLFRVYIFGGETTWLPAKPQHENCSHCISGSRQQVQRVVHLISSILLISFFELLCIRWAMSLLMLAEDSSALCQSDRPLDVGLFEASAITFASIGVPRCHLGEAAAVACMSRRSWTGLRSVVQMLSRAVSRGSRTGGAFAVCTAITSVVDSNTHGDRTTVPANAAPLDCQTRA